MAVTLIDAAKAYAGDPLKQGVIETFARESDILRVLPFEDISGAGLDATREDVLPGIGFRGVNGSYTEDAGNLDRIKESLRILGGDMDVDKFIVTTMGEAQRAIRTAMKVKAAALKFTASFVKGDSVSTPEEFDGLQNRLGSVAGNQVIHAGATSGGDALSLQKLDALIDSVDDTTHLLMNKTMRNLLTAAARNTSVGGNVQFDKDDFGRRLTHYNGLPILIADKDNADVSILPFTETNPGGGTAASCSIYALSLREGMLTGIQSRDIEVEDLGLLESKPAYRTRVEWFISFAIWHRRAAGRLLGIKNAAIVA